jgi:signal transduction histidine kinase
MSPSFFSRIPLRPMWSDRSVWYALCAILALLALNSFACFRALQRMVRSQDSVIHTQGVLAEAQAVSNLLADAETGERGFLLLGDQDDLEPFTRAVREVPSHLKRLGNLVADNRAQRPRTRQLAVLVSAKLGELERTIVLRRQGDAEAAVAVVRGIKGHRLTVQTRDVLKQITDEESSLLSLREDQARLSARDAALTFVLATGLAAAMLVLLSFVLQRGVRARLRAEDALRRTEKLAASGRMAATIAHEINNPLEAVTNLLYLANQERSDSLRREYLSMADRELRRVAQITRKALGFYRENTRPTECKLAQLLDEVLELYTPELEHRRLKLHKDYASEGATVAVVGELRQVFSNLIANAIQASEIGGSIIVRVHSKSSQVRVEVADSGSGIRPEHAAHIFEPFFTTKVDVGTGLGLWVSKDIIERHGGELRFTSNTGAVEHGTCFSVELPAAGPATAKAGTSAA